LRHQPLLIPPRGRVERHAGFRPASLAWAVSFFALTLVCLGADSGPAFQESSVSISGTVRSEAGAVISGAEMTLTDEKTSTSQSALTASNGEYSFASVSDGVYTLSVKSKGFTMASHEHIPISAGQSVSVNFSLVPAPPAGAGSVPGSVDPLSNRVGYYDETPLKPSAVQGAVDAGGYSAPGQARATNRMIHGVAGLKKDGSAAGAEPADPAAAAAVEARLKIAVARAPQSFETNHQLGEFYLHTGKPAAGIPYFESAEHLDDSNYDNGYDLARACLEARDLAKAREQLSKMIARQDSAGLHDLLGDVEEASGNSVAALNEYERAAQMDPSEENIFDWGSELLLHQSLEPAIDVFSSGVRRYPASAVLLIGQGVALYARGRNDDAVKALCAASDISPADPRPYLFLGRMYNVPTAATEEVTTRLARFVKLEPKNATARFDYAMSVWKGQRARGSQVNFDRIETLLKAALDIDPKFPDAHFELGNLYSEQKKYPEAIGEYQQALAVQPEMVDAHFRLAQAYARTGDQTRAQQEFVIHDRLRKQQSADMEKQRNEIKQFVDSAKGVTRQ
jgi:tetratricopeptide (TPR) repeat protein